MNANVYVPSTTRTLAERGTATAERKLERVATMQALIDSYADAGIYVPDAVTYDYEVAVSDAVAWCEFWNVEHTLDC